MLRLCQPEELVVEDLWEERARKVECDYVKIENPIKASDLKMILLGFAKLNIHRLIKTEWKYMGYLFLI